MKDIIVIKADKFAHDVYSVTKEFPREEIYGVTSQFRRASLSVVLNLIEGYARNRTKEHVHFLDIAYGSLKETKYLIYFCFIEKYLAKDKYDKLMAEAEEIGKLIWVKMKTMKVNSD